jgi:3'-phosphoadenosine 5'-phosphosulfate (PAPS) 3'-phosphatase
MVDIVTNIDKQVETFVKSKLSEQFPTFQFLGEEEASVNVNNYKFESIYIISKFYSFTQKNKTNKRNFDSTGRIFD